MLKKSDTTTPPAAAPTPGPYHKVKDGQGKWHIASDMAPDWGTEARYHFIAEVKSIPAGQVIYRQQKAHVIQPGEEDAVVRLFEHSWTLLQDVKTLLDMVKEQAKGKSLPLEVNAIRYRVLRIEGGP